MAKVSVVMTSYNHCNYLSEAIESVLSQTLGDFELIIVDDASKDGSQEIINRYQQKDSRIRSILHEKNQGISRTTNDGFLAAKEDYIAYIQSDDRWLPEKLEKQIKILQKNNRLVVWSDASIIDKFGNKTGQLFTQLYDSSKKLKTGNLFSNLVNTNYICGQSMILDRRIAQHILFDPKLVYSNDYKFMIEVSREHEFHFIEEPLTQYRIHGNNSIRQNERIWEKDIFIIRKFILQKFSEAIPPAIRARLYERIGKYINERKHFGFANKFFLASIRHNPLKTSYYKKYLKTYFKCRNCW
ncbi:MAG: glycosyltransferase [Phycisphaerae bacterium]|nr:glycosyltransferase [Phycisphaerae bacterium]